MNMEYLKRFVKKNLFLVGVLGISALVVILLLVLSVIQYTEMGEYINKTNEMREKNEKLMRARIPAVQENIDRLQQDTKGYNAVTEKMKVHFGQSLYKALQVFCAALVKGAKQGIVDDLAEVDEKFRQVLTDAQKDKNKQKEVGEYIKKRLTEDRAAFDAELKGAADAVAALESAVKSVPADQRIAKQAELQAAKSKLECYTRIVEYYGISQQTITPEMMQSIFRSFWEQEKASQSPRVHIYRLFRAKCGAMREGEKRLWHVDLWDVAMKEFIEEAQKTMIEPLDSRNREEVFLSSLGLQRNLDNQQLRLDAYRRDMRDKVDAIFAKHDISISGHYFVQKSVPEPRTNKEIDEDKGDSPGSSSGSSAGGSVGGSVGGDNGGKAADAADEIRHWDIISDIARRIVAAKINSVDEFSYVDLAGREENNCRYYTYTVAVSGSEKEIVDFMNRLSDAYKDNRLYVVKRFQIKKEEDQIQDIIDVAQGILKDTSEESGKLSVKSGNGAMNPDSATDNAGPKVILQPSYFKEEGKYPECVAGRSDLCEASLVIEYVVFNGNVLK